MNNPDVIVVGAGPAGSSAAYHLAKAGAKVLILDRSNVPDGRYKTCGGGFSDKLFWSFPYLHPKNIAHGAITELLVKADHDIRHEVKFPRPVIHMTMRAKLDARLLKFATDAGAVFRQAKVIGTCQKDSTSLMLVDGSSLIAPVIVAADGANSPIAHSLGLPRHARQIFAAEDEVYGAPEKDWAGKLEIRFTTNPVGYYWVFPKADHLSVGFGGQLNVARKIKSLVTSYAENHVVQARHNVRGHHIPFREPKYPGYLGGVYIVGDAGGFVDPTTAEGISWGALSGKMAAESILGNGPNQWEESLHWFDNEITASRAFRNHKLVLLKLGRMNFLEDDQFWDDYFKICAGQMSYQDWYVGLGWRRKWLSRLIDRFAPF